MKSLILLLKELKQNFYLVHRLAVYDNKKEYASSSLGFVWHFINPIIQISIFYVIFGLGIRGGEDVNGVPFFLWMVCGMVPWFFINSSLIKGANSIHARLNMVSKMKFPLSVLPFSTVLTYLYNHFLVLIILIVIVASSGSYITFPNILLLPYFIGCGAIFLIAFSYFTSTLSTVSRDFYLFLQSVIRLLFYATPIFWEPSANSPEILRIAIKFNPFYYVVEGYREALLGQNLHLIFSWHTIYFWGLVLVFMLYGSYLHMKFRRSFVDYM
ncbi:MAG: ABC transporter permease [Bacillaceae bacterium]